MRSSPSGCTEHFRVWQTQNLFLAASQQRCQVPLVLLVDDGERHCVLTKRTPSQSQLSGNWLPSKKEGEIKSWNRADLKFLWAAKDFWLNSADISWPSEEAKGDAPGDLTTSTDASESWLVSGNAEV